MKILDLTIVGINMGDISPIVKALDYNIKISEKYIQFKKKLILTDINYSHPIYEVKNIPKLNNIDQLNLFCIKELWKYIDTPHFMIIQPDGYIINPELWKDDWLNYDYIGAPWSDLIMRTQLGHPGIGNGGFCIRSKSLAKFVSNKQKHLQLPLTFNEDGYYSNKINTESFLKYPTTKEALAFSQEMLIDSSIKPFGIHGAPYSPAYKMWAPNTIKLLS